jgi:hypothetical protein
MELIKKRNAIEPRVSTDIKLREAVVYNNIKQLKNKLPSRLSVHLVIFFLNAWRPGCCVSILMARIVSV